MTQTIGGQDIGVDRDTLRMTSPAARREYHRRLPRDLRDYLLTAPMRIVSADAHARPQARAARFPGVTFLRARLPRMSFELFEGHGASTQAVLLILDAGSMRVHDVIVEAGQIALVLPGPAPVLLEVLSAGTELTVVGCAPALLEGLPVLGGAEPCSVVGADRVNIAPFVAFIAVVCAPGPREDGDRRPLEGVSRKLARELLRIVADAIPRESCLYARALGIMELEYTRVSLTVEDVAARLGVSSRTLLAEFNRYGQTVKGALCRIRARAASSNRAANPGSTSKGVARMSGFGSESSMLRAVKALRASGEHLPTPGDDASSR